MSETTTATTAAEAIPPEGVADAAAISAGLALGIYARLVGSAEAGQPIPPEMLALARAQAQHAVALMERMIREFTAAAQTMDDGLAGYAAHWLADATAEGRA